MKDERHMRFGEYIRAKRLADERELTLGDVAQRLGISRSLLSDIEAGRRKPLREDQIDEFCQFMSLNEDDQTYLYDLAARETSNIPSDIEDTFMYTNVGDLARAALRMSNAGLADEEDWKRFIRELERKKGHIK